MRKPEMTPPHTTRPNQARNGSGQGIRVLLYRRILPALRFRDQLQFLEKWGYTPVTFNDCRLIDEGELIMPRKPIILTFDGGHQDIYDAAIPVLQEFGMKAVVFIPAESAAASGLRNDASPDTPAPLMSERNILELHQNGFEIGSNALTYRRLTMLSREEAWDEISRSRMKLEIMLNARVHTFAYPHGLLNGILKEMVAAAGYRFACSSWSGPINFMTDPFEIRRIEVSSSTGWTEFAAKVAGPYPAYHWLKSKARTMTTPRTPAGHSSQAKTLFLVSAGLRLPERAEWARREAEDKFPRQLALFERLNADVLDERYLLTAPLWRRALYRPLGTTGAQILEAFFSRKRYDVILSWAEHLGLPLAGLMRFAPGWTPHVSIFSWISKPKKARILKIVHRSIDRIILMSSAQRDFAVNTLGIPPSRIALLRWPVDEKFWRPLGSPQDTISAVGREMRDYATLIEALRGTGIPCHIAAGGQLEMGKEDPWIKDIGNRDSHPANITIGAKNFSELRNLYDRSRFVVIPLFETDTDNGNTSILEAMAMGKAVICSRVKGQLDVIQEGITGLFVPPGDVRALRDAITSLWEHPERAEEMGRNGRSHIEKYHALDAWVEDVRSVIEDVLEGGPRRLRVPSRDARRTSERTPGNGEVELIHETR
jgi:glycosyltransferase involved in cell wall biosynthesis